MHRFKRYYIVSATLLSVLAALASIGGVGSGYYGIGMVIISLSIAALALFPVFWKGGILANPRLSIGMAALFAIASGCLVGSAFMDFVTTGGGEGPNGEGSPLAGIIALAFTTAVGFCPWLLTILRGLPHWNAHKTN